MQWLLAIDGVAEYEIIRVDRAARIPRHATVSMLVQYLHARLVNAEHSN
ncbi:MAG TPA: hypothetical protein VIJ34_08800 [Acidimicrobiales bacterium]